eukprot:TRINITY_DN37193_c0_g1_i1.p1 TRINITY_DN37193_c0_g1~~TRINITY_DN37193_c0_g1_i1.p1  ORF type:complete len:573 (-),score=62.67 TRINITY_DN37193_c0_g1_i1:1189-2907(-)
MVSKLLLLWIATAATITNGQFCDCTLQVWSSKGGGCGTGKLEYEGRLQQQPNRCNDDFPLKATSFKVNADCGGAGFWGKNAGCNGGAVQMKSGTCIQLGKLNGSDFTSILKCQQKPSACSCQIASHTDSKCSSANPTLDQFVYQVGKCIGSKRDGVSTRVRDSCSSVDQWSASATCQGSAVSTTDQCAPLGNLKYGKLVCKEMAGMQCDQNTAQACFLKYMSKNMLTDSTCTRMQMMTYCYVSHGCTAEIMDACEQAEARCPKLTCRDPRLTIEVVQEGKYNQYFITNTEQFVLIDTGESQEVAIKIAARARKLMAEGRQFKSIFITHPHPAQLTGAWKIKSEFPNVPMYVGTELVRMEAAQMMYITANPSDTSPANPRGNAVNKFDYLKDLKVINSAYDLWGSWDVRVYKDFYQTGQNAHFSMVHVPSQNAYITGAFVAGKVHLNMGFGVNLISQCDWISALSNFKEMVTSSTVLYTAQGATGLTSVLNAEQLITETMNYIKFARQQFSATCAPSVAVNAIKKRYPDYPADDSLLALSANARVPQDANLLGCKCTPTTTTPCVTPPPACGV